MRIKGYASPEEAELVKATLFPLATPVVTEPGACGGDPALFGRRDDDGHRLEPSGGCPEPACAHTGQDPRDSGARMWDALVEACRRLRATDSLPHSHGSDARLFVMTDLDDLREQVTDRIGTSATMADGIPLSAAAVRRLACDAHHVAHWADGGSTSLDNLVLLCRRHHTLTHHTAWTVSIDPDSGRPRWRPPPQVDDRDHFTWVPASARGRPLEPAA